ncbi:MAG: hypothetical protein JW839_17130 [Candidatus Lokiarchaeota archaeon]|nr:hypothetical protein [Candidatus Lokiarchaeota archaeon]
MQASKPDEAPPAPGQEVGKKPGDQQELPVKIPSDARTIWAFQRFFMFSLVLAAMKIYISFLIKDYQSIRVIAIDAVLDLAVAGLSIYLIQLQERVFKKVNQGIQDIKVSENGVLGIASIQGLIFLVGGAVVFIQSLIALVERDRIYTSYYLAKTSPKFDLIPELVLATIISLKLIMYIVYREEAKDSDNLALKSLETNLLIDLIVNLSAWGIVLSSTVTNWLWFYMDPIMAMVISFWMIVEGGKYFKPLGDKIREGWEENNRLMQEELVRQSAGEAKVSPTPGSRDRA